MKKELTNITPLVNDVKQLIDNAKQKVVQTVDNHRVMLYWNIGQLIFKDIQQEKRRAEYGKEIIKNLSKEIEPLYGSGYSYRQLYLFLQFYKTFPKVNTLCSQLNWSQYKLLIRIKDEDKREFYIAETIKNYWSKRALERQINSSLFERLLLSNDKKDVLAVVTHQDLGQLQMYVNYYDRVEKLEHENPTIGVLLCADKNDTMVKYSLPKDNKTILASKYQLYLPSIEEIRALIKNELENLDE